MTKTYTADEVRELLRRECEKAGGQKPWATDHNVSLSLVSMVLGGKREAGYWISKHLGLRKIAAWTLDNGVK